MQRKIICIVIFTLMLMLTACEKKLPQNETEIIPTSDSSINNFQVIMKEIPFIEDIELEENQEITIMDIYEDNILYDIWHWNDAGSYALTDRIGVWNINTGQIVNELVMEQQFLFSAKFDNNDSFYLSYCNVQEGELKKWYLVYWDDAKWREVDSGIGSKDDGMGCPSLIRVGREIVYVYETQVKDHIYCFGSKILDNGNVVNLEDNLSDRSNENDAHFINAYREQGSKNSFVYFVENNKKGYFRVVSLDGEIREYELSGKLYDYLITDDYLIVSGVNEESGQKRIMVIGLNNSEIRTYDIAGDRYRQCFNGINSIISVNQTFEIFCSEITSGNFTEYPVEIEDDLKKEAVAFLPDGKGGFYFIYMLRYSGNKLDLYHVQLVS